MALRGNPWSLLSYSETGKLWQVIASQESKEDEAIRIDKVSGMEVIK